MKLRIFIAAMSCSALLGFAEPQGPDDDAAGKFVKGKLPPSVTFKFVEIKSRKVTEKEAVLAGTLTVNVGKHLYRDVTAEVLPELESQQELPAGVTAPVIIKKSHGSGEIIEIPLEVRFQMEKGQWEPGSLDDQGQIEDLGKPQDQFKLDALVFGSSQSDRVISQFRKDLSKAAAGGKHVETATSSDHSVASEKPGPEAAPSKATPGKRQSLDAMLDSCRAGQSFKGLMSTANGMSEAMLRIGRVDDDGAIVTAEINTESFKRTPFIGRIRENPSIKQQFELLLVGTDVATTRTTGKNATAPSLKRHYIVLALEDDGTLVGDITSVKSDTSSSSSAKGTPLTQKKLDSKEYPLSFKP